MDRHSNSSDGIIFPRSGGGQTLGLCTTNVFRSSGNGYQDEAKENNEIRVVCTTVLEDNQLCHVEKSGDSKKDGASDL